MAATQYSCIKSHGWRSLVAAVMGLLGSNMTEASSLSPAFMHWEKKCSLSVLGRIPGIEEASWAGNHGVMQGVGHD